MTVIQIIALLCLPFIWVALAQGPSRAAMRGIRRNARIKGISEQAAYNQWLKNNRRKGWSLRRNSELNSSLPWHEETARVLILNVSEEIEGYLAKGDSMMQIQYRIKRNYYENWSREYGDLVACRAAKLLDKCGPEAFLTPEGARQAGLIA